MYSIGRGSRRVAKYEESKSHMVLATIINFTITYCIYVTMLAAFNSFMGEEFVSFNFFREKPGIILLIITGVICIAYAVGIHEKVGFITLGEKITGRQFIGIKKVWVNPYARKRRFLFIIVILNMYILANYFGGIPSVYSGLEFFREVVTMIIHIALLVNIGQGKINYTLTLVFLYTISLVATIMSKGIVNNTIVIVVFSIFIFAHILIFFIYRRKENEF